MNGELIEPVDNTKIFVVLNIFTSLNLLDCFSKELLYPKKRAFGPLGVRRWDNRYFNPYLLLPNLSLFQGR